MESEEKLDPRVQVELEKLNKTSEEINNLELDLDRCRTLFRQTLTDSTQQLNGLSKKLGSCIDKARPYYEARVKSRQAQIKTQDAALRFERACSQLVAAKEMVTLAEEGFFDNGQPFDPAWQEMLNHATVKVNEAEKEKVESEFAHMETATQFSEVDQQVKSLQKDLKRNINKSRPYFDQKARFTKAMEEQKHRVDKLGRHVTEAKRRYAETLRSLELISAEIHHHRREARVRREMGCRGSGVGAESPAPPPGIVEEAGVKSRWEEEEAVASLRRSMELNPKPAEIQNQQPQSQDRVSGLSTEDIVVEMTTPLPVVPKVQRQEEKEESHGTTTTTMDNNNQLLKPTPTQSSSLRRTGSYEEALVMDVTEATRRELVLKKVGDDGQSVSQDAGGSTSKLKAFRERLFGGILGNNNTNASTTTSTNQQQDREDGLPMATAEDNVRVISERVVEVSNNSTTILGTKGNGQKAAQFTVGEAEGNCCEAKNKPYIPKARLPSDAMVVTAPRTYSSSTTPSHHQKNKKPTNKLNLDVTGNKTNDQGGLLPTMAVPEILTPEEENESAIVLPMDARQATRVNSELMASLQQHKGLGVGPSPRQPQLPPSRSSGDMLLEGSDSESLTGSLSSMNLLDDDQIHGMTVGFEEMEDFVRTFDSEHELRTWKGMSLPAKLSYIEDYVNVRGLRGKGGEGETRCEDDIKEETCQLTVVSQKGSREKEGDYIVVAGEGGITGGAGVGLDQETRQTTVVSPKQLKDGEDVNIIVGEGGVRGKEQEGGITRRVDEQDLKQDICQLTVISPKGSNNGEDSSVCQERGVVEEGGIMGRVDEQDDLKQEPCQLLTDVSPKGSEDIVGTTSRNRGDCVPGEERGVLLERSEDQTGVRTTESTHL